MNDFEPARTVLLDVDGTLVDTNYLHVIAWQRAFRSAGIEQPAWTLHRTLGQGGDRFVAAVAGDDAEAAHGDAIRAEHDERYMSVIDEAAPLPGAVDLIERLRTRGVAVVLASSGKAVEIDRYLDKLGVRDVVDAWTSSDDVESTKPAPDLVEVALERVRERPAVLVGDTPWDCEAAARAGIACIAVLCGGFGADELRDAGARSVYRSAIELADDLDGAGIAGGAATGGGA